MVIASSADTICCDNEGVVRLFLNLRDRYNRFYVPKVQVLDIPVAIEKVACGLEHFLCLDTNGFVWSSGKNGKGQLGHGNTESYTNPTIIEGLKSITGVFGDYFSSFCIDEEFNLFAFGNNQLNQLGLDTGLKKFITVPTKVPNVNNAKEIVFGADYTIIFNHSGDLLITGKTNITHIPRRTKNTRYCWNQFSAFPYEIPEIISVVSGYNHILMLTINNEVLSCGKNDRGQLGIKKNTKLISDSPFLVSMPQEFTGTIVSIHCGRFYSLLVDDEGRLWGFGNGLGTLNEGKKSNIPTLLPSIQEPIRQVSTGKTHGIIVTDSKLYSFGIIDNYTIEELPSVFPHSAVGNLYSKAFAKAKSARK